MEMRVAGDRHVGSERDQPNQKPAGAEKTARAVRLGLRHGGGE